MGRLRLAIGIFNQGINIGLQLNLGGIVKALRKVTELSSRLRTEDGLLEDIKDCVNIGIGEEVKACNAVMIGASNHDFR